MNDVSRITIFIVTHNKHFQMYFIFIFIISVQEVVRFLTLHFDTCVDCWDAIEAALYSCTFHPKDSRTVTDYSIQTMSDIESYCSYQSVHHRMHGLVNLIVIVVKRKSNLAEEAQLKNFRGKAANWTDIKTCTTSK